MSYSKSVLCALSASALMIPSLASSASADPVAIVWTGLVNAQASGSALSKTGGCSTCYDGGAFSQQQLTSGSVTFSVAAGQSLFVGLGHDTSTSTSFLIDYAFHFYSNGVWEVREGNVYRTEGPYTGSDQFTISIAGGVATYYRNGTLVYTSQIAASGTYVLDTSLQTIGTSVQSAQMTTSTAAPSSSSPSTSGSTTTASGNSVLWTSLVNAAASGSTVTKTSGCGTCYDGGGHSQQQITSGSATFSVPAGLGLFVGLGYDTSSSTSYSIDYAFRFYGNGQWEIREGNVYRTEGAYSSSDQYTISTDGNAVRYYRNGSLVYTSTVAPSASLPLLLHASLESIGAAVQNAVMSGTVTAPPPPAPSSGSSSSTSSPSSSSSSSASSGSTALRVLQWNTHHGGYGTDGVYDPNRLATWAASFHPDVVMFNEIERNDSWGNQDQPEVYKSLLEQKTGKTWYSVFAQEFGQWNSSGKGNLILSSYPIQITDLYELTHNYDRSIALATITVNARDITLISTHLDPYDATLRLTQATEVSTWAAGQPENRILTGDMNAWPDQTSIAEYDQNYNDSWDVATANGTAVAFPGNTGQTKNGRIDYIFYSKNASSLSVVSSQVYDTRDANGIMPSDHRPVLTVFSVR